MSSRTKQPTCSDAISFPGFTSSVDYFRRKEGWSARKETEGIEGRRERDRKRRPRTFVKNKTQGWDRRLAPLVSWKRRGTGNERKERDDEREKTQVPAESWDITLAMPSQHRDVLQPRRRTRARFIGRRAENLCGDSHWQVVLLATKNRNFSPTLVYLLSPSPVFSLFCSLSLSFYLRLEWSVRNWRNERDGSLNAIKWNARRDLISRLLSNVCMYSCVTD